MTVGEGPTPIERLGRWDGKGFVPVESGSLTERRIFVMSHGWCRGMLRTLDRAGGYLAVWDARAETETGSRFDGWYGPLAEAILASVPDAVVLGFTWLDESSTENKALYGVRSQMRTTVNGQRLAVGLESALDRDAPHDLHLIGFSHGAKVVTIAATLLDPLPRQVTLLDSPDGALPVLGGALNDLTSHLRVLQQRSTAGSQIFVDSYPSFFGVRYGTRQGLGSVVDVALDPEAFPLEGDASPESGTATVSASLSHGYAWRWYVESARNLDQGVGFGWSPMLDQDPPVETQLRQRMHRSNSRRDPLSLESADARPGTLKDELVNRVRRQRSARLLSTEGKRRLDGLFWRRSGDLLTAAPLVWQRGSDSAEVRVTANRTERARVARGWSDSPRQLLTIPLGGTMSGPVWYTVVLEADEAAAVEVYPSPSVYGVRLPPLSEINVWVYPLFMTAMSLGFAAITLGLSRRVLKMMRRAH